LLPESQWQFLNLNPSQAHFSLEQPLRQPATCQPMFTGIIEETGIVERIEPGAKSLELTVRMRSCARGLKRGGSLAINGCCLTAVRLARRGESKLVRFDVLQETWQRTNLQFARPGDLVNLERPLRAGANLGGHFVTGHVDGLGRITRLEKKDQDYLL